MPRVLFGISGSIAAFKALELIRLLVGDGFDVRPVVSRGGSEFVTRTTLEALTGNRAMMAIFEDTGSSDIPHIEIVQGADLLVTCPASADIIAKFALGISDDPLSLTALTYGNPHVIAPAMNFRMWEHPATQHNVQLLKERGCVFVGPDRGLMACGEEGWGRLASIKEIHGTVLAVMGRSGPLRGRKILVSAGATREHFDDIRYITNRSTGRMGYALAEAARDLGASVILVTSSTLDPPAAVRVEKVNSAAEMYDAIMAEADYCDASIMASAVADFTPEARTPGKIKKKNISVNHNLKLVRTADILKELGAVKKNGQVLVGFAAEWGPNTRDEALRKLKEKHCDLLCLNDVSRCDVGFAEDDNEIIILAPGEPDQLVPKGSKRKVADVIMNRVAGLLNGVS